MMLRAKYDKKVFLFKQPSGTSRGILTEKKAWFITLWELSNPKIKGIGECSVIPGLSPDYETDALYESKVKEIVERINYFSNHIEELRTFPSMYFGLEMALLDLKNGGKQTFFETPFTKGQKSIPINGLIWMGEIQFMKEQIEQKLKQGFTCIKMKIGALDFDNEIQILKEIRQRYSAQKITLRVDANGAFTPSDAIEKLNQLADLNIHSIEQPIKQGQIEEMKQLCKQNILPIALDEELIGIYNPKEKKQLLNAIQPQYIILKPSLIGGFKGTKEWIDLAEEQRIPWWITSALESNIGLNAIAQFTSTYPIRLEQGLGTGALYKNNVPSQLEIVKGELTYIPQ